MENGEKFTLKCPVCGSLLAEMGIADGRLYYECLWQTNILRTRFEEDHKVKRRLMRGLNALSDEAARVGHDQSKGRWSNQLVWRPMPGGVVGDELAEVFLSFRYYLAGDKLIPVNPKAAPSLRLPEEAFETGVWGWNDRNRTEVTEEDMHGGIRVGKDGKKK